MLIIKLHESTPMDELLRAKANKVGTSLIFYTNSINDEERKILEKLKNNRRNLIKEYLESKSKVDPPPTPDTPVEREDIPDFTIYHEVWRKIHKRPFEIRNFGGERQWLIDLMRTLPCGACRRHSLAYLEQNPPKEELDEISYFQWGVEFHNSVNRRTGKPEMTVEEALNLYRPQQ